MEKKQVLQCDDKLTLIAEKTIPKTGKKLNYSDNFRNYMGYARDEKGHRIIYSYWDKKKNKSISPDKYEKLSIEERSNYIACAERKAILSKDAHLRSRGNLFYLVLHNLSTSTKEWLKISRYRASLENLLPLRENIFPYNNRGGDNRAFIESTRNFLKRNFKVNEYEYNLIFLDNEMGEQVYKELSKNYKAFEPGGTIYIKGFDKQSKKIGAVTIKIYNAGKYHGLGGDCFKIEITLRSQSFKKERLNITDMTTQEKCIEKITLLITREILKLKGGEMVKSLVGQVISDENILANYVKCGDFKNAMKYVKQELIKLEKCHEEQIKTNKKYHEEQNKIKTQLTKLESKVRKIEQLDLFKSYGVGV